MVQNAVLWPQAAASLKETAWHQQLFLQAALLIQLTVEKSNGGQRRFAVWQQGGYANL